MHGPVAKGLIRLLCHKIYVLASEYPVLSTVANQYCKMNNVNQ